MTATYWLRLKQPFPADAKLYALQTAENSTLFSTIVFDSTFHKHLSGEIEEKGLKHSEKDSSVNAMVSYYSDSVLWQQNIKAALTDSFSLKGTVSYLYKNGDEYLPGEKEFKVNIQPEIKESNGQQGIANKIIVVDFSNSIWWWPSCLAHTLRIFDDPGNGKFLYEKKQVEKRRN